MSFEENVPFMDLTTFFKSNTFFTQVLVYLEERLEQKDGKGAIYAQHSWDT